jgi:hypothetical protein
MDIEHCLDPGFCRVALGWATDMLERLRGLADRDASHTRHHGQVYGLAWALGAHAPGFWQSWSPLSYDHGRHDAAWRDGVCAGRAEFLRLAAAPIGTLEAVAIYERARAELPFEALDQIGPVGGFIGAVAGRRRGQLAQVAFQRLSGAERTLFMHRLYRRRAGEPDPLLSWPGPVLLAAAERRKAAHG